MEESQIVVVGGGIGGALFGYLAQREGYRVVVVEERSHLLEGASGAAGAFLFPKVGLDTPYTRFINRGILEALSFWEGKPVELDRSGVLILPRDTRDLEKFRRYRGEISLQFEEREGGFFFPDGGVLDVGSVRQWLEREVPVRQSRVVEVKRWGRKWVVVGEGGEEFSGEKVVLAEGSKGAFLPKYLQIYPIWGERIEFKTDFSPPVNYHKRVSLSVNFGGVVRIGATHRRNCSECRENWEEGEELVKLAREIVPELEGEIVGIKGGFRAASRDYFPVVGEVIDLEESLKVEPQLRHGWTPRGPLPKVEGLYILNGLGGRGFSNALLCGRYLLKVLKGEGIDPHLDPLRHLLRYLRKILPSTSQGKNRQKGSFR